MVIDQEFNEVVERLALTKQMFFFDYNIVDCPTQLAIVMTNTKRNTAGLYLLIIIWTSLIYLARI